MDTSTNELKVIELHMMNKLLFYPYALASGVAIRTFLYPVTLIRTRLQVQKQSDMYKGLCDAFIKVSKQEGFRGLYKGVWINQLNVIPQMMYITIYENCRQTMKAHTNIDNTKLIAFVSGGCASLVNQTFVVPVDVVSQHLQMHGTSRIGQHLDPIVVSETAMNSRGGLVVSIVKEIYRKQGLKGFYRGYFSSVMSYGSQSAIWWSLYYKYMDLYGSLAPLGCPRLAVQAISGMSSGVSASCITNPLDIVRARVQVQNTPVVNTAKVLWKEERWHIFTKGLTARMTQSVMFSFFIVVGYESIKRLSVLDEYKHHVEW